MRRGKKGCTQCGARIVVFAAKGVKRHGKVYRPRADHDLCRRCFKAYNDRTRIRDIAADARAG